MKPQYPAAPRVTLMDWALAGVILVGFLFSILIAIGSLGLLAWGAIEAWRHVADALKG